MILVQLSLSQSEQATLPGNHLVNRLTILLARPALGPTSFEDVVHFLFYVFNDFLRVPPTMNRPERVVVVELGQMDLVAPVVQVELCQLQKAMV